MVDLDPERSGAHVPGRGAGANWTALFRTTALFRRVATDVARQLALEYPHRLDAQMRRYLERIRAGANTTMMRSAKASNRP